MIRVVFFDIDGTLLSHRIHDVPTGARQALEKLKELKIDRVVASGRCLSEIRSLPTGNIDFDAFVTLNGQLCLNAQGNVFYENPLTDVEGILKLFREKIVPVTLIEKDISYINFVNENVAETQKAISSEVPKVGEYTGDTIYQAIIYVNRDNQDEVVKNLKNVKITRWHDNAIDVVACGGSKVTGIKAYLQLKGYQIEETAAFGDGENDIEMLKFVHSGIAMGNADESVKQAAKYITAGIDEDGLRKGLRYLEIADSF